MTTPGDMAMLGRELVHYPDALEWASHQDRAFPRRQVHPLQSQQTGG